MEGKFVTIKILAQDREVWHRNQQDLPEGQNTLDDDLY